MKPLFLHVDCVVLDSLLIHSIGNSGCRLGRAQILQWKACVLFPFVHKCYHNTAPISRGLRKRAGDSGHPADAVGLDVLMYDTTIGLVRVDPKGCFWPANVPVLWETLELCHDPAFCLPPLLLHLFTQVDVLGQSWYIDLVMVTHSVDRFPIN